MNIMEANVISKPKASRKPKAKPVIVVAESKAKSNINTLKLRTDANNNWKNETFSLSALIRYARDTKGGKNDVQAILDAANKKNGTKVGISQVNLKNVLLLATHRELHTKDEDKNEIQKTRFSFWLVVLTIGRLVKQAKANK